MTGEAATILRLRDALRFLSNCAAWLGIAGMIALGLVVLA